MDHIAQPIKASVKAATKSNKPRPEVLSRPNNDLVDSIKGKVRTAFCNLSFVNFDIIMYHFGLNTV